MLSLTVISPNQGETYYTAENYYSNEENQANSTWSGKGARSLGLSGQVQGEAFKNLLHGNSTQGDKTLSGRKINPEKHRAGIDLTFSAPKSLSLAALVGGNEALEQAHRTAMARTLEVIEERYAQTRVRTEEGRKAIATGNLIVAQFHHDTSREKDPQLHTHCVVINATQLADGRWQSLHNDILFKQQKLLGMIYQNELAVEVQRLGYAIDPRANGQFELQGYRPADLQTFSKRREQILATVGENATAQERELATLMTRAPKGKEIPREELRAYWQAQAEVLHLEHPQPRVLDWQSDLKKAVQAGLNHCSEREAVFRREQVERFALENHLGQQFFEDLQQTLDTDPEVIHTDDQRLTTQTAVLRELETIRTVLEGRGQVGAIASEGWVAATLADQGLTQGQYEGILLAATTRDRVIAWQGVAGAGKSFALNQFRRIAEAQGYTVRGFAPSAEAAKSLGESAQIQQTETVAALLCAQPQETPSQFPEIWVVDEAGLLSAKDALALLTQAQEQQARVILVGDTRQLSAVEAGNPFKSLQQAGMVTAYLHQSLRQKNRQIKAGVDLIAEGKIAEGIQQLKPYIHQVSSEEARAQEIAHDYLTLTPEERRKTLLLAGTNRERLAITQAIRAGLKSEGQLGQNVLMQRLKARDLTSVQMAYAHHFQVGDVLMPQASYRRWGLERGQRYEVLAVDVQQNVVTLRAERGPAVQVDPARVGKKSVYRIEEIEVAIGDRLKWTKNQATLGRRNGQEFEVYGIEDGQVLIHYGSGKTESLSCSELAHLDYAMVSTTYGAQGKSAERVIGALDRHLGRENFYVTVSRVKHDLRLYASEDLDRLIARAEQSRAKENPGEVVRIQQDGDQQLASVQTIRHQNSDLSFRNLDEEKQGPPLNNKIELER
ncbi:Multifunctional conjugation protein TraI [Halomicronema hongdechloris C2206]|uniref:Multifunctional conjugation protein TraI n=1 Tax=Halomicronema hongdechloris C2206 TaxID=1641165 RepID=A0A1Z3HJ95_9CYAN|nr:MobF family relaxase [Halomicronema hongdechloris]ASC70371.1 Multifunctional conjugation protein TraI [Halomicronema hongdechloris C2206]